ncbi:unnamed protein product [Rhizoctonia solani]|uniref:Uncharacterized protein n=1 Tax=Rhizoctonia solani TaxID=456999 RepID=A0A8H3B8I0_9AGAM|nr:unnamed protein product [Rhizoctonia solani]
MPTGTEANTIMTNHCRLSLFELTGWRTFYDIKPPLNDLDESGNVKYWKVSPGGKSELLYPRPGESFDSNWAAWGDDYISQWHNEKKMGGHSAFLSGVSDDAIKQKFRSATWKSVKDGWKKTKDGNGTQARTQKNIQSLNRNRVVAKLEQRVEARKGTPLEGPEYDFLFTREYTSPEASDAENNDRVVVDEPFNRAPLVSRIYGALAQKAKYGRTRTVTVKRDKSVYLKVDTPLPETIKNVRIARWAIRDEYFKTHQVEIEEKKGCLNTKAVESPDLAEFLDSYGEPKREYVVERPRPKKERAGASTSIVPSSSHIPTKDSVSTNPALLQNPDQNPTPATTVPKSPPTSNTVAPLLLPTPNATPIRADQLPELLPYASSKTATELAAEYAADSVRQGQVLDLSVFGKSIIPSQPPLQSTMGSTPATSPDLVEPVKKGRRGKRAAPTIGLKRVTRAQTNQVGQEPEGLDTGEDGGKHRQTATHLDIDAGQKMPTRLKLRHPTKKH